MTYSVFFYNMILIVAYVVLAVVFFWLHRSRSSRLAWWLMVLFACSFVDNGVFFMKEVFTALGRPDPGLTSFCLMEEAFSMACFPFVILVAAGHYYNDMPPKGMLIAFGAMCLVVASLGMLPFVPYVFFDAVIWVLYASVFLRMVFWVNGMGLKAVCVLLAVLYAFDAAYRVFGLDIDLLWGKRDLVIEACWAVYLACGAFVAVSLLHTVEKPYLPNADITFRRFLDEYGLSGREGEIVKLLMDGESNQDICNKLFIAPGTVKAHNHSIYKKLGIKSRSQVVLKYTEFLERCAQESRLFC